MARYVHAETGMKRALSGRWRRAELRRHVRILRVGPFDDLWIEPAAGDAAVRCQSPFSSGTNCLISPVQ